MGAGVCKPAGSKVHPMTPDGTTPSGYTTEIGIQTDSILYPVPLIIGSSQVGSGSASATKDRRVSSGTASPGPDSLAHSPGLVAPRDGSVFPGSSTAGASPRPSSSGSNLSTSCLTATPSTTSISPPGGFLAVPSGSAGAGTSPGTSPQVSPRVERPPPWQKGALIGQGAFGSVFLGLDLECGRLLAVKQVTFHGTIAAIQSQVSSLMKEIALMRNLEHENIVRYMGVERRGSTLNILMEYVPGGSLAGFVAKFGALGESVVRVYTSQILKGLAYLHSHKILHRDIKGANILVHTDGTIKLADFGASKQLVEMKTITDGFQSMKGTPFWMAPEVIKQTSYGRGADIWSVGCTVIEMASGKPPWSEFPSAVAAMFHIADTDETPALPTNFSAAGIAFLKRVFQRDPKLRPSAMELLEDPWMTVAIAAEQPNATLTAASVAAGGTPAKISSTASEPVHPSGKHPDIPRIPPVVVESTKNAIPATSQSTAQGPSGVSPTARAAVESPLLNRQNSNPRLVPKGLVAPAMLTGTEETAGGTAASGTNVSSLPPMATSSSPRGVPRIQPLQQSARPGRLQTIEDEFEVEESSPWSDEFSSSGDDGFGARHRSASKKKSNGEKKKKKKKSKKKKEQVITSNPTSDDESDAGRGLSAGSGSKYAVQ